ncbi:MAG: hypothetical protein L3K09_08995, partial [Thermoplasmata archaeon]|nr:hypothetical protein [Thermoplasmata archaeon]
SSFGVSHRLQLSKYDASALTEILAARAQGALRPGSYSRETLEQIARVAAPSGDARFALELLVNSARAAEQAGSEQIGAEAVRAAKGSIYPTVTESKLEELSPVQLMALLALARLLKGPGSLAPNDRVRIAYQGVAEEYGQTPVSRVTFWRTIKELEREALITVEAASAGHPNRLGMDEVPASLLTTLLEARLGRSSSRKA